MCRVWVYFQLCDALRVHQSASYEGHAAVLGSHVAAPLGNRRGVCVPVCVCACTHACAHMCYGPFPYTVNWVKPQSLGEE